MDESRVPVIAAVGQSIERTESVTTGELGERAARAALREAPGLAGRIRRVTVISSVFSAWSRRAASELADALGLAAGERETTTVGGNTPQWLVTRAAEQIAMGTLTATLVAGAESTRSARAAGSSQRVFRPSGAPDGPADPVVGAAAEGLLSEAEVGIGLFAPAHVYPLFESVLAARAGRDFAEQRRVLGALMAPFTEVAARNPYAWFPQRASADELATPATGNRVTAEPYTKRMNAFPNVDQGAALVICSLAEARRAGLADQLVFVWSGADAADVVSPTARPDLGRSPGIRAAVGAALEAAAAGIDDIDRFDFYSCFPSAVQAGAEAAGLAVEDPRGLTVTGGHPYFGGPGNNYTAHAIATLVERLRERPGLALATGLGGFITKHAAGVYGSEPPPLGFRRGDTTTHQRAIDASAIPVAVDADGEGEATVVASTVVYDNEGQPTMAPVIAELADGRRVAALAAAEDLGGIAGRSLVGARISVGGSPPTYRVESEPAEARR